MVIFGSTVKISKYDRVGDEVDRKKNLLFIPNIKTVRDI